MKGGVWAKQKNELCYNQRWPFGGVEMPKSLLWAVGLWMAGSFAAAAEPYPLVEVFTHQGIEAPGAYDRCGPPIYLDIARDGPMIFRGRPVGLSKLYQALEGLDVEDYCNRIFIRAAADVPADTVIRAMTTLRHNGVSRVGLIDPNPF
jgi:hypothetical protein